MLETVRIAYELVKGGMHRSERRYVTLGRHSRAGAQGHGGRGHSTRVRYASKRTAPER